MVFDSAISNASVLLIGNKENYVNYFDTLEGVVRQIYFAQNYKEALTLIKTNEVDIVISNVVSTEDSDISFLQIKYINQYVTLLLIIPREEIELIELATIYGVDNFVLSSIDKDTFLLRVDKIITISNQKKELNTLTINLEQRVKEEIEKNREKDKMMLHQSRLAAMGEMIGNISHQWRQPLAALKSTLQSIKLKKKLNKLTDEYVEEAIETSNMLIEQMNQTIDDFRNFFKPNKTKNKFFLSKVVHKNLKLLDGVYKNFSIDVMLKIDDDFEMNGYENELSQALLNILNNSKDVLSTKNYNRHIFLHQYRQFIKDEYDITREYMILDIRDNGGGIPDNIINKIFEPYFTTKHQAQGTGIGLYMTKQIIENNMYGQIDVKNIDFVFEGIEMSGAEFTIKLPL